MIMHDWRPAPVGSDAQRLITRVGCRNVLVVVHTIVSCHRLLDVIDHIESDPRVQLVFTVAPGAFHHGVDGHLRRLGALVLPWAQATRESFDLAIAAAYEGLHEIHAPLMMMAHGAGHGKLAALRASGGPLLARRPVYGLD